jgi:hypothetical protein
MNGSQPVAAPSGQTYGKRKEQEDAQKAIPLPNQAAHQVVPLNAPTTRPDEPVMHGAPMGAGGGPEVLGPQYLGITDDAELELREMVARFPQYASYLQRLLEYYR